MAVILSSEMIGFGLNFLTTVIVARYLGLAGFGKYSFVLALVGAFQLIADSGLNNILVREISVNRDKLPYQLGVTKSLIWVFSVIVFILIAIIVNVINIEPDVRNATYIMGIAVLATVHAIGYSSIFRAMEEMEYNAAGFILHKVLLLAFIFALIKLRQGLVEIAAAYLVTNILLWFFYYVIISKRYGRPKMVLDLKKWWYLVFEAVPVGISSILRKVSWQVDILILSAISTKASVGLFSASYKVVQAMTLLPQTLTISLFPVFSRLAKKSHQELFDAYERNLKFMCLISVPIVVVLATLSREIIFIAFGEKFVSSYRALHILSIAILFLFPSAQFIYLFSALGKQRLYAISSFLSLGINALLDYILIPRFDFIGACIGTLASEVLLFGAGVYFLKSIYKKISFTKPLWKPLVAGLAMWAVLYQFAGSAPIVMIAGALASLSAFALANIILKTLSGSEIAVLKESILFFRKPEKPSAAPAAQGDAE
ncbi:MAG: flippase [Nitrospiraceae bacterium]|nr:flippase [Nitrospiraceae bacterium]